MGIKNLNMFLKRYAPSCIKTKSISDLSFNTIAIDTTLLLYKFKYAIPVAGFHYKGMCSKIEFFRKHSITPIFVFDGIPPNEKDDVLQKRKERMDNDDSETSTHLKITREEVLETIFFCACNNISHVTPEFGEAEAIAAQICKDGEASYVYSEDTDTIVYGAKFVITKMDGMTITIVDYNEMLSTLSLTSNEFIDLSILLGCDYCKTVKGVGPVTAFELMKKYRSIDRIVKECDKYKQYDCDEYLNAVNNARNLFMKRQEYVLNLPTTDKISSKLAVPIYRISSSSSFDENYDENYDEKCDNKNDNKTVLCHQKSITEYFH